MGKTIRVEYQNDMNHNQGSIGIADYKANKILLQDHVNGSSPMHKDVVEQTFFHELTHMILNEMSADELNNDETFVTVFSGLLYQAIKTMK